MKKYKVMDSLGETIGWIETTGSEQDAQDQANKIFRLDNPKIKLVKYA